MFNRYLWLIDIKSDDQNKFEDCTVVCKHEWQAQNVMRWTNAGVNPYTENLGCSITASNVRPYRKLKFIIDHIFGRAKFIKCK